MKNTIERNDEDCKGCNPFIIGSGKGCLIYVKFEGTWCPCKSCIVKSTCNGKQWEHCEYKQYYDYIAKIQNRQRGLK